MTIKPLFFVFVLTGLLLVNESSAFGQTPSEEVFRSYADFQVGGTWKATVGAHKLEHSYRWAVGRKFAQLDAKGGVLPLVAMFGVDPASGKCTWWFYYNDGSMGKGVMTQERDGVYILEGKSNGMNGENSFKVRMSRVDDNTMKEEIISFIVNGVKQPNTSFTWNRQKEQSPNTIRKPN